MKAATTAALNKLCKWRTVFAGWQLGTRGSQDAEGNAVRDHRDLSMLTRAEVNALTTLLLAKGVFTAEEYDDALRAAAVDLDGCYERFFPGFKTTAEGVVMTPEAVETTRRMNFRP